MSPTLFIVAALFGETRVEVEERRIRLSEQIRFDYQGSALSKASYRILDEVAKTLRDKREIEVLRIEAHNDSLGVATKAMAMSEARAKAVKAYLISKGVEEARLLVKGYGQEWPVATNWTVAGRRANRRVEFVLVKVQGREVGVTVLPSTYARVLKLHGPVRLALDGDPKGRALAVGGAVMSGQRVVVEEGSEVTLVFGKLHFIQAFGPAEFEIAKADSWTLDAPARIILKAGRVRLVVTSDSSRDFAVRVAGAHGECAPDRGEGYLGEMTLHESAAGTDVVAVNGKARCADERVGSPGVRFSPGTKVPAPLKAFGPPVGLTSIEKTEKGVVELSWEKLEGALKARLEIARDPSFIAPVERVESVDQKAIVTPAAGKYFWRVIAIAQDGTWSPPSQIMSFTIKAASAP